MQCKLICPSVKATHLTCKIVLQYIWFWGSKSTCLTILESPESIRTCFSSENGELWLPSECERWKGRQTSQCPQAPAQQIRRRVWFLLLFWRNWDIKVRNWCLHACVPDLLPHERSVIYNIEVDKWKRMDFLKIFLVTVKTQNHFYLCKKSNPKHSLVPFNFFWFFFSCIWLLFELKLLFMICSQVMQQF